MIERGSIIRRASGMTIAERLDYYSIPEPNSGCVLWFGSSTPAGYGQLRWRGKNHRATHLAWEVAHGRPFPPGMFACHKCDVPACINPRHIFVGTNADNVADMRRKGRARYDQLMRGWPKGTKHGPSSVRGEAKPAAKLTEQAVREIKSYGKQHRFLARQYNVSRSVIRAIIKGKIWVHV